VSIFGFFGGLVSTFVALTRAAVAAAAPQTRRPGISETPCARERQTLMTDSRAVALAFGKKHLHELRTIRTMQNSAHPEIAAHAQRNFALSDYQASTGRRLPMYRMIAKALSELVQMPPRSRTCCAPRAPSSIHEINESKNGWVVRRMRAWSRSRPRLAVVTTVQPDVSEIFGPRVEYFCIPAVVLHVEKGAPERFGGILRGGVLSDAGHCQLPAAGSYLFQVQHSAVLQYLHVPHQVAADLAARAEHHGIGCRATAPTATAATAMHRGFRC